MPMMRIPTPAMLGKSRKLRLGSQRETTKLFQKDIKKATDAVVRNHSVDGKVSKRKVAEVRAKNFAPKKTPSVYETGRIRHPQNAWRRPKMPANYMMAPHQTSSWSAKKKGY